MAAAFFNKHKTRSDITAISAGILPAPRVDKVVCEIMSEVGIDLSNITPAQLTLFEKPKTVGMIVTMACNTARYREMMAPYFPKTEIVGWRVRNSRYRSVKEARAVRDEIEQRVKLFILGDGY
ncbi:hypothetical protein BGX29_007855 [Mortierella sp. GBA35]|nr:hypothetical protein BGX29_007855 [Mortierella sp. GBA35]